MTKLPTDLSGKELVKILSKIGFVFQRQQGSHMVLRRESPFARVVVPNHRNLRVGTLRTILNEAGIIVAANRTSMTDAISSRQIIGCDVFPNLFNVSVSFGVKDKFLHERLERRSLLLRRRREKASSPSIGFTRPLFMSS